MLAFRYFFLQNQLINECVKKNILKFPGKKDGKTEFCL